MNKIFSVIVGIIQKSFMTICHLTIEFLNWKSEKSVVKVHSVGMGTVAVAGTPRDWK